MITEKLSQSPDYNQIKVEGEAEIVSGLQMALMHLRSEFYGPRFALGDLLQAEDAFKAKNPGLGLEIGMLVFDNPDGSKGELNYNQIKKEAISAMQKNGQEPIIPPLPGSVVRYDDFIKFDDDHMSVMTPYKFGPGETNAEAIAKIKKIKPDFKDEDLFKQCEMVVKTRARGDDEIGYRQGGAIKANTAVSVEFRLKNEFNPLLAKKEPSAEIDKDKIMNPDEKEIKYIQETIEIAKSQRENYGDDYAYSTLKHTLNRLEQKYSSLPELQRSGLMTRIFAEMKIVENALKNKGLEPICPKIGSCLDLCNDIMKIVNHPELKFLGISDTRRLGIEFKSVEQMSQAGYEPFVKGYEHQVGLKEKATGKVTQKCPVVVGWRKKEK